MDKRLDIEKIKHLADLARIDLPKEREEKLLNDAENILVYFDELEELDTENIEPMTGGTSLINSTREDEKSGELLRDGIKAFPKEHNGYLEVPAVIKEINTDL